MSAKERKKCHIYKQIVDFSHRCYIQPYQSKMNHESDDEESASYIKKPLFIFFDFECRQDTGVHIPNFVSLTEHVIYVSINHLTFIVPHVVNSKKEEKLFPRRENID